MVSLMEVYSMTDTIPLSPTAQAVRDAVLATYADNIPKDDNLWALDRASVVAALRAAADQVVPKFWHEDNDIYGETMQDVRQNLLAIAAELEAQ
jgi:hypothetical protein